MKRFRETLDSHDELELQRLVEASDRIDEFEARLPALILDGIASLASPRSLAVERVNALEKRIADQVEALRELQEHSARTDESLALMVSSIERLANEMARPVHTTARTARSTLAAPPADVPQSNVSAEAPAKPRRSNLVWMAAAGMLLALAIAVPAWQFLRVPASLPPAAREPRAAPVSPMDLARQSANAHDYAKAEQIYKEILVKNPKDAEVVKALASVLFRQDKIEESANVLRALSTDGTNTPR